MLTINKYVKAKSLEEAYELNQARTARVMGGMMWMRLGGTRIQTIIDLSGLGLDQIEETEDEFRIGAMCTLRRVEKHEGMKQVYGDEIAESVRHIVGVQFRNQATVGGSIYGRFGFSDVLTCLLALDTSVELYNGGRMPLSEFVNKKRDKDILVSVIIKKSGRKLKYAAVRQSQTDFPVLACAVAAETIGDKMTWFFSVGARPMRAALWEKEMQISKSVSKEDLEVCSREAAAEFTYATNMRGSSKYRRHLAEVLILRGMRSILAEEEE
ncbi:MAG: FAD binding domain-containing protein [Muricomes sp.]